MTRLKKISAINKLLAGTAGIYVLGLGMSFIFNWAITKILPQEEVGYFQYFISIITFGVVVVPLGFHSLIQREANSLGKNELRNFNQQMYTTTLLTTLGFSIIWGYGVTQLSWVKGLEDFTGLYISIIILPIYALLTYFRALLQGQNKVYWSVLPEVVFRPLVLLIATGVFYMNAHNTQAYHLLIVLCITLFVLLIPSLIVSNKNVQKDIKKKKKKKWLQEALTLLPIGILYTVNERIDVIMISKNLSAEDNAVYAIAFKFAAFSAFGLVILNSVMVPLIAKHFKNKSEHKELEGLIKPGVRKAFLVSTAISLVLIYIGEDILSFFGKDAENYNRGYTSMVILIIGQLLNVMVGSVGYILTMAKLEKMAMYSIAASIGINIILNYILLPRLGIEGAAISTAIAMIAWNGLMLIFVKRKTGLNSTIF